MKRKEGDRASRWRQRIALATALLAAGVLRTGGPAAQQLVRSEDAVVAVFSLQTELEVDGKVLRRLEDRLDENRRARAEARDRVGKLYEELDALFARYREAIHGGREGEPESRPEGEGAAGVEGLEAEIEAKQLEVMSAERTEAAIRDEGHRLREEIRRLRERMSLLAGQIDTLIGGLPSQRDTVTGIWDVTLLPSGVKGVFALFQSGTLVTGQYVLDGPFQGSLDGTLIDHKLLLHRIDARLGRSMDLTASLAQDGQALRGTWENYDLSNGQARTGSWSARRRPQRRPGEDGQDRSGP